jgi:hypothetical protein
MLINMYDMCCILQKYAIDVCIDNINFTLYYHFFQETFFSIEAAQCHE